MRSYCIESDLSLPDLEAAARVSERNQYLRVPLARLDGLRLGDNAYGLLEQILIVDKGNCIQENPNASKKT